MRYLPCLLLLLALPAYAASNQNPSNASGTPLTFGPSVSVTNPQISGDTTTGLYTAGAGKLDISISGAKQGEWSSSGLTDLAETITPAVNTSALTITGNTDTASTKIVNITETWNNSGVTYDAPIFENITDTASASASIILDLQVGGATKFKIDKSGNIASGGAGFSQGFNLSGNILAGGGTVFLGNTNGAVSLQSSTMYLFDTNHKIQIGNTDAASPSAQTVSTQNVSAGTSNTAGVNLTIAGSMGTGTGAGGDIVFQVAPAGSTGTSQNALVTGLRIFNSGGVAIGPTATPADNATCTAGTIWWDTGFLYVCTASGTVKRAALSTF